MTQSYAGQAARLVQVVFNEIAFLSIFFSLTITVLWKSQDRLQDSSFILNLFMTD